MDGTRRQRWLWRSSLEGDAGAAAALLRESTRRDEPGGVVLATLVLASPDARGWEAVSVAIDGLVRQGAPWPHELARVGSSGLLARWAQVVRPARDAWLEPVVANRMAAPWLSWCSELEIRNRAFDTTLSCALRAATDPGLVRSLTLVGGSVPEDARGLRAALWPWIGRVGPGCLQRLELRSLAIGSTMRESRSELFDALLELDGLAGLRELALVGCQLDAGDVVALSRCEHLRALRRLDLADNDLGDPGAEILAATPCLQSLERLELSHNHIGDRGTAALANSQRLPALRRLGLDDNLIGYDGACALAGSPAVAALEHLDLYNNRLDVYGCNALSASQHLRPELRRQAHEWQYRATDEELLGLITDELEGYWELPLEDHIRLDRTERAVGWEFELSRYRDDEHWQEMQAYAELRRRVERDDEQQATDGDTWLYDHYAWDVDGWEGAHPARGIGRDWYGYYEFEDAAETEDANDRAALDERLEARTLSHWRWWDPDDDDWLWLQAAELCHDGEAGDLDDTDVRTWPLELATIWSRR